METAKSHRICTSEIDVAQSENKEKCTHRYIIQKNCADNMLKT